MAKKVDRKYELQDYLYVLRTVKAIYRPRDMIKQVFSGPGKLEYLFVGDTYFYRSNNNEIIKINVQGKTFHVNVNIDGSFTLRKDSDKVDLVETFHINRSLLSRLIYFFELNEVTVYEDIIPNDDEFIEEYFGTELLSYILVCEEIEKIRSKVVCIEKLEDMK